MLYTLMNKNTELFDIEIVSGNIREAEKVTDNIFWESFTDSPEGKERLEKLLKMVKSVKNGKSVINKLLK